MKKVLIVLGVLFMFFAVFAAVGGWLGYTKFYKPAKAFADSTAIMQEVMQADAKMQMTMDVTIVALTEDAPSYEEFDMYFDMEGVMVMDIDAEKLYMDMLVNGSFTQGSKKEDIPETDVEITIIGEDMYVKSGSEVQKMDASLLGEDADSIWDLGSTWEGIDSRVDYTYVGEEEVEGVNAYKYEVNIDRDQLGAIFEQMERSFASTIAAFGVDDISFEDVELDDYTYTVWVSTEDNKPLKETVSIEGLELTIPDLMSIKYNKVTATIHYNSVNEPVKIVAPK